MIDVITLEDKLELFTKMVYEKVQTESEWKLKKMKEENEKLLAAKKDEFEARAEKIYGDLLQRGELKKSEMISQAKASGKKAMLLKVNGFVETIVDDIYAMARDFVRQESYLDFLSSMIKSCFEGIGKSDGIAVHIIAEDIGSHMDMIEELIGSFGHDLKDVRFEKMAPELIGGVIVQDTSGSFRIDNSIASLVEESREFIGQIVHEYLGEKGDFYE